MERNPGVSLDRSWDCLASHLGRARRLSPPLGLLVVVLGLAAFRRDEFPADNWWYGARADSPEYAPPPADESSASAAAARM